jgi:UDP-glucuronate decarboxylase
MISLVTGGAGFIGSHLCKRLLDLGHHVICLDDFSTSTKQNIKELELDPHFTFRYTDVRYQSDIVCDNIFHLACPASPLHYQADPVRTIDTCYNGTKRVLELALKNKARLIIASTSEVYGDPEIHPQSESYFGNVNPVGPRSSYDEGKRAAEALAVAYRNRFNVDVRILRLFNCYGPQMNLSDGRLIPNLVCQAIEKKPLTIYGDGNQTRSLCYVSDTVEAFYRTQLMECSGWEVTPIMNIGNPDERTVNEIAIYISAFFKNLLGYDLTIEHLENAPEDPKKRCPDISAVKAILNWEPVVEFDVGIKKTIEWFIHTHKYGY